MEKTLRLLMLLSILFLTACKDDDDNQNDDSQQSAVDAGPSYTDKTVEVNRDGNAYGQVSLRFYSDMPSVAYISVADFHKLMTGGETMKVARQGDLYQLATRNGTATVDVRADYLNSTTYAGFVDLMWMLDPTLAPNAMYDGNKYIKFVKLENVSTFKPSGVRLDFSKYSIDLHDDGTNVYFPFATLADIYSDCNFHNAACHDDLVVVSTKLDTYSINTIAPDYAAKPYQRAEVTADMAKFRYQELCFVFDNLYGYPGRTILEQNGMAEKGFDAALDVVQNGKVVKKLLQSANNMDFAWGRMATQCLINDGGHTDFWAMTGLPENIEGDYVEHLMTSAANYPEALAMYQEWAKESNVRSQTKTQLETMRNQAYGDDVLYKANSTKTTAVIILNSFMDMDEAAWKKYYASAKSDADWQELMKSYKKDVFIGFLYGLGQAKADGVKNLVLDISVNGGGSCDIVGASVAMLRKNRTVQFWSQDALEDKNKIATYYVDSNFDGVFDEKDDTNPKFDCSDMNIAVLCSKVAFSCGHQFPTLMKDYGFPIIGEQSGGGTCCIQVMQTADGQNFMISTYRDRSTDKAFANTDAGIPVTEGYAFDYTYFYDLNFLTNKMNALYSK